MIDLKNFKCKQCGACCSIPGGIVRVSESEIARIAAFLSMSESEFIQRECEVSPDRNGLILRSNPDGGCVWLTPDKLCRLHEVKPDNCRTFPYEWINADSHEVCPALKEVLKGKQSMQTKVVYIDRKTRERVTESVMGDKALRFAYETLLGRTLWAVLFGSKFVSALMGRKYDSPASKKDIVKLASIPGCMPDEAEKPVSEYGSFNEFFTRRLKPGARPVGDGVVSPADGRMMLYPGADADTPFPLKGATRSLRTIFDDEAPAEKYDIAVIRLAPVDYHRFHFPTDCTSEGGVRVVPGRYHSVNPIAIVRYPDVYALNERQILKCHASFGDYWLVDVGAFGVGTIVQTFDGTAHAKGDEKGYFKFGGSTVIFITKAGVLKWDDDIIRNSSNGFESRVLCGEKIAVVNNAQ